MAKASQILNLIKAHFSNNEESFKTAALQVAAHEAKLGHVEVAKELKELVLKQPKKPIRLRSAEKQQLADLVFERSPKHRLSELVVDESLRTKIKRIISEYHRKDEFVDFGLRNRKKILLSGPPGTGKTLTASIISNELNLPLYVVMMDRLITRYLGETSAKLRQVFDLIREERGVYLFDEFDAIRAQRGRDHEVGELRRVLNSFLQFIEEDESESLIIAATNTVEILDQALFRRFDDVLTCSKPDFKQAKKLIQQRLFNFDNDFDLTNLKEDLQGLSHADIAKACDNAVKQCILEGVQTISSEHLKSAIEERRQMYHN
jgi:SpoVK/Ycf46/Vps4 family AAA+-type ATPase